MKKRILLLISLIVICLTLFSPLCVNAATPLDPNAKASLTITYRKGGAAFSDLTVGIYRVAQAFPSGIFELIEPFSSYPVNIHDIMVQEQWTNAANTLNAYIVSNHITPDAEMLTDEEGVALFTDLETGLYLVEEVAAENTSGTYVFNRFMVYLPTPQADGSYNYAVEARPKCTNFVPKTQYTVTKLWQDSGNQASRPKEVSVEIYKDGQLYETQILSASNNWTYTWFVNSEEYSRWTVTEPSVSAPYKLTVKENGNNFSIINTWHTPTDVPQTGDTFAPLPWIIIMCLSGILLVILGVYSRRHKE